jgi:hypothetical protein
VAHLLERSPATVRVQLHRGLEQLRASLPRSLALAALGALGWYGAESHALRGLAAIKTALLTEASLAPLPLSFVGWIGVQVMGQKFLLGGLAVAALTSLLVVRAFQSPLGFHGEPAGDGERGATVLNEGRVAHTPDVELELTPAPTPDRIAAHEARPIGAALDGIVVDALTGTPVAGATVELHAPLRGTSMQLHGRARR